MCSVLISKDYFNFQELWLSERREKNQMKWKMYLLNNNIFCYPFIVNWMGVMLSL